MLYISYEVISSGVSRRLMPLSSGIGIRERVVFVKS